MVEKGDERGSFVKWFSELSNKDVKVAGGKGASLAEMYNNKFPIPPGFVVTADSYAYFIEKAGLKEKMSKILEGLDIEETEKLEEATKEIRALIMGAEIPKEITDEVEEAYEILDVDKKEISSAKGDALGILRTGHEPPFVAVRSSATAEDLVDASFAGQQESFLNVKGLKNLLEKIKACFASLFTARATYYREKKKFNHLDTHLAVVVQKMIDSDKSGVMFSTNPVKTDGSILIEAVWGLGEGIVSGRIKPDQYVVEGDLEEFKIKEESISVKKEAITRDSSGKNIIIKLTEERAKQRVLSNYEVKRLAQYGRQLEEHYGKPQDIEFAIANHEIYIVQSRPVTTKARSGEKEISGEVLLSGLGASPGAASGVVRIVESMTDLNKIKKGDILVTKMTNPDMVVTMQKAAGIITDEGGLTSHASIVSREMGIPAVVGTGDATIKLKDGQIVTVDGNYGKIYEGRGETKLAEVHPVVPTRTKIKVIVDLPEYAERAAKSGVKGIGLTRIEGIIASSGKHPLAFKRENKINEYIQILHDGLKKISMPFEEVWIRTSDIRSDEYRNLEGAPKEVEGNPMLGDHGIRFSLRHPEILKAELTSVKELADEFPQKKFGFMFPQVISVVELREVKRIANEDIGMPSNIKIGVMVETPAAVQIINDLCEEKIDFISFGTNDLTQYTLAIDRNNQEVQYLYDEMSPAVLNSIKYVIRRCKKYGVETSICGQAGSKEEMVRILVGEGINSISVNADAAKKISEVVAKIEEGVEEEHKESIASEIVPAPIESDKPLSVPTPNEKKEEEIVEQPVENKKLPVVEEDIEAAILRELEGNEPEGPHILRPDEPEPREPDPVPIPIPDSVPEPQPQPEQPGQQFEQNGEYQPGNARDINKDVPSLNDSIPVDSSALNEEKEEEEMDLSDKSEWKGDLHEDNEWKHDDKVMDIF